MGRNWLSLMVGLAATAGLSAPASAVTVSECNDFRSSVHALAEPWEANSRTFLNGAVRIAVVDTGGEPACCSVHLLVLAEKPEDATGPAERVCRVISQKDQLGFMAIDFAGIRTSYTPAYGLNMLVPYRLYVDGIRSRPGAARINVNPRTGIITAR